MPSETLMNAEISTPSESAPDISATIPLLLARLGERTENHYIGAFELLS